MTEPQIIDLVVRDPVVRQSYADSGGQLPDPASLRGLAGSALQNVMNALLNHRSIAEDLRAADYTLSLSGGTSVTQGVVFTLPQGITTIATITIGSGFRPVKMFNHKEDFEKWWYERVGETSTLSQATVAAPWGKAPGGRFKIIISPGVGSDTSANIHHWTEVGQPIGVDVFPAKMHHVLVSGTKNRMTGGRLQPMFEADLMGVVGDLDVTVDEASPLRLGDTDRSFNWRQSMESASFGSDGSLWPTRFLEG